MSDNDAARHLNETRARLFRSINKTQTQPPEPTHSPTPSDSFLDWKGLTQGRGMGTVTEEGAGW